MATRKQLQELLSEYKEDTLNCIQTVRDFCDEKQKWTLERENELKIMTDIKDKAYQVSHKFDVLKSSNNKAKGLWECLEKTVKSGSITKELEMELGDVLENTLQGLKKLDVFLDAVEKLAVTSQFVFNEQSFWPKDKSLGSVRSVIMAARKTSPLLINFKRNAETFFFPSLSNLEVLTLQLDKYIQITEQICETMEESSMRDLEPEDTHKRKKARPVLKFSLNLRKHCKMLDHLKQLCEIRMDQNTRLAFIFQENAQRFIDLVSESHSRMEKHLSDLEESADQLEKMKKGASISNVAGRSIGIIGKTLSITGLALAPATTEASLGGSQSIEGLGLAVASGANSLVKNATEVEINRTHEKKAENIFKQYMEDMEKILSCLEQASRQEHVEGPAGFDIIRSLCKDTESLADGVLAGKILKFEEEITAKMVNLETRGAKRGSQPARSESVRAGLITANALFIGVDVLFICKESINLAKGSESKVSQLIRSRAALLRSELEDWKKIHDSLCIGITRIKKSQEVLEQPFHP